MEVRGRKFGGQTSPERTKVWIEPHSKNHAQLQQGKRVPVVYYLCRNRHLEHPHFMEVPLSPTGGLHLRDVINKLNALRGKRMASMYSWSCKRSYKNGFVWHDLSEDDLILPAHGNEYILKGSELLDQSPPGQPNNISTNTKKECLKNPQFDSPKSGGTREGSSSSSSPVPSKEEKKMPVRDDDQSQSHPGTGPSTPRSFSSASSPSTTEYRVITPVEVHDASTQTEERRKQTSPLPVPESVPGHLRSKKLSPKIARDPPSPALNPTYPSTSSSVTGLATGTTGRVDTLESLIRATYRPRFTQIGFPSPIISTFRNLDRLSESTRTVGLRGEEPEYFSGSLMEAKKHKEDLTAGNGLRRSTSFEACLIQCLLSLCFHGLYLTKSR